MFHNIRFMNGMRLIQELIKTKDLEGFNVITLSSRKRGNPNDN